MKTHEYHIWSLDRNRIRREHSHLRMRWKVSVAAVSLVCIVSFSDCA